MWKLAVWECSASSPVIYAEDIFDQHSVFLAKLQSAHPQVFFSSHLGWNLSASLTFPSLISISTFKFKDTRATESPHFVLFISSIPIPVWFTRQSVVCLAFSTTFLDCDISVCAHSWRSTSGHALWHTVEVRGPSQLSDLIFNLMWSRDFLSHPHHCECQERWPVDYWGLSCVLCHSPHRNAGIADALAACLAFTWALGILTLSLTKPSAQSCPWHFHVSFEMQHDASVCRCFRASNT